MSHKKKDECNKDKCKEKCKEDTCCKIQPIPGPIGPTGSSGIIGPTGSIGPLLFAYTYLYNNNTNFDPYTIPDAVFLTGITGLVEYEFVGPSNTSSGSFVYESDTTNASNITGVTVPFSGDYQIDFTVTGYYDFVEGGYITFDVAVDGVVITQGSLGTTSTVQGFNLGSGMGFVSSTTSPLKTILTGSVIISLTDTQIVRLVNLEGGGNPVISSGTSNNPIGPSNSSSIRIVYIGPTVVP